MDESWRFRPPQGRLCPVCSVPHFPFCQMPMPPPHHGFDHYRPEFHRFTSGPSPPLPHQPPFWDHRPLPRPPNLHPPESWGMNHAPEREIFRPFVHPTQRFSQDEFLGEISYKRMRVEEPPMGTPLFHPSFDRNEFVPGRKSAENERRLNLIRDHGKLNEGRVQFKGEFLPDRFARDEAQSQPGDARVDHGSDVSKFNSVAKSGSSLLPETTFVTPNRASLSNVFEAHRSFAGTLTSYGDEQYPFRERLDFDRVVAYDAQLDENRIGRYENRYSVGGSDVENYPNARRNQSKVFFQQNGSYSDDCSVPNPRYNVLPVTDELPFSVKGQQATHNTLDCVPRDQFEQNDCHDVREIHAPKGYHYGLPNAEHPEQGNYLLGREKSSHGAFGGSTESRFKLPIQQTEALRFPSETKIPDISDTQRPLKPVNYPLSEDSSSENFVLQGGLSNFTTTKNGNGMTKDMVRMHTTGVHLSLPPALPTAQVPVTSSSPSVPPPALFPVIANASAMTSIPTNKKYPDPHILQHSSGYIQQPPLVENAQDLPLIHQAPLKHYPDGVPRVSINHAVNAKPTVINACDLFKQPLRASRPDHITIILRGLPGSGKSYLAKALRDIEIENGGNAPRIHAIDDYFMVEVEKNIDDNEGPKSTGSSRGKKQTTKKVIEYCYESEMEEAYRSSMLKAFKKTLEEGIFTFIIVDDRNLRVADFAQFWAIAKRSGYEVYLLEAPYKDPMGCAARNVHGFTLEDVQKMAEKWEESPPLYLQIDIQSLFHGDDLNEHSIQEVDMDINDSDCDNSNAKLEEESPKLTEPKTVDFVHKQDSSKLGEKWESDDEEDEQTRIKELGRSKWLKNLDEEQDEKPGGVGKNLNALSGLMHAYTKGGKSVHWGDRLNKSGFSIGAVKKHSLIIGPGSGYNLASNPVVENQDSAEATKNSSTSESKRQFSEKLRAEHESIRAVLNKRRQRIGGFFNTEDD